jgi:hypothetical protein
MSAPAAFYHPRNPQSSDYYRCVEDHFETFVQVFELSKGGAEIRLFQEHYAFFQSVIVDC